MTFTASYLRDIDGIDDLRCPACNNMSMVYDNYNARPEKTIGDSVQCMEKVCRFYAEYSGSDKSILDILNINA